jgi:NAD(P)-dependent dehydrogenase (short-subunit alcohol dehydrogenase family)
MSVNLFGTYTVIQAFLPSLIASGGAIVNNVSIAALAPIPLTPPTRCPRRRRSA